MENVLCCQSDHHLRDESIIIEQKVMTMMARNENSFAVSRKTEQRFSNVERKVPTASHSIALASQILTHAASELLMMRSMMLRWKV